MGGLRIARFCRYLPAYGIRPIVLTVQERFHKSRDGSLPPPAELRIERTAVLPTPLELYSRWKAGFKAAATSGYASSPSGRTRRFASLRGHVIALLQIPDPYWGWYLPALRAAERLLERETISAVLSSGPPWISHVIALHLKKKYRLPWLADFRDPWADDPLQKDLPGWRQRVDQRLESSCLRWADRVLCNTDRLRDAFVHFYPGLPPEKFVILTNGFDDPVAPSPSAEAKKSTRLFLHLGGIYGLRRIDTFCEAVAGLVNAGKIDANSFKILFLGGADPYLAAAAHQRAPELIRHGCIEFHPRVDWREAQQALWGADLLLIFQGGYQVEVPAKFYEYLVTGKPIFAVVQEGALSDLVQSTGSGVWADPGDPAMIGTKFLEALELPARPPKEVQQRWYDHYHYRSLTGRLAELIGEVAGAPTAQERSG